MCIRDSKYLLRADWIAYAAKLEVAGRPQAPLALIDGLLQSLEMCIRDRG